MVNFFYHFKKYRKKKFKKYILQENTVSVFIRQSFMFNFYYQFIS